MAHVDHFGISVRDVATSYAQYVPVLEALGYTEHGQGDLAWFGGPGHVDVLLYAARDASPERHAHGRVGWQHLAYAVHSPEEVDRLHTIAVEAGWSVVRAPKLYPRFSPRYYASFVEDGNGIRLEFAYKPREELALG